MQLDITYLVAILLALLVAGFIFELFRRDILKEKYAFLWILVSLGLIVIAVFPQLLSWASGVLGFAVPANLLFLIAAVVLLLVSVQFSFELSKLEGKTRRLAEEVALMRNELDRQANQADSNGP